MPVSWYINIMNPTRVRTDKDAKRQINGSAKMFVHGMLTLVTMGLWFPVLVIVLLREYKRQDIRIN